MALFIKSVADVIPSIWLIFVCIWSSTLFSSALSILISFLGGSISKIVYAITVCSCENESICAVPAIFIALAFFTLPITFLAFFLSKNALHVNVLVPSYKSKLYNTLPDFNSLSSEFITSPSNETFLSSTPKSFIFTNGSFIVNEFPKIKGELLSSSGSSGTSASVSITEFAIIVTSPANVSNPAFPIIFIAFTFSNFSNTIVDSSIVQKDLHVIIPVPS